MAVDVLPRYNNSNSVNALLLLFVFDKMDIPLTEHTVAEIVCTINNWIAYMDYRQAMGMLLSKGWLAVYNNNAPENEKLYALTTDGRVCLSHLFFNIPSHIRAEIVEFVNTNRMMYRKKQEYTADYTPNDDGTYTTILRIADTNTQILELALTVPDRTSAAKVYKEWSDKAPIVYKSIIDDLLL